MISSSLMLLSGCSNMREQLGISELEWTSYSKERQQKLIERYTKINQERLTKQTLRLYPPLATSAIEICIENGQVVFPPDFITWQSYNPVKTIICEGECQHVTLTSQLNRHVKTKLRLRFENGIVVIDAHNFSQEDALSSLKIYRSPLWEAGHQYTHLNTDGYTKLKGVNCYIRAVALQTPTTT